MKNAGFVVLGLVAVLGTGATFAAGFGHHGMMKNRIDARITAAEDLIQATPAQRQVIDQAKTNILAAVQQQKGLHQTHAQFMDAFLADNFDAGQMNTLVDQRAEQMRTVGRAIVQELAKVHDTLTSDQRQKLAAHVKEQRSKGQDRRGGFGGPGE